MAKGSRLKFYTDIEAYNENVTGSCIQNTIHFSSGRIFNFIVDHGVYQEKNDTFEKILPYNDCVNPDEVDAVLLTHTHLDHDGALPLFVKQGYNKKIYMSTASSIILPVSLGDCFNVMRSTCKIIKKPLLFSEDMIDKTLSLVVPCDYEQSVFIDENKKNIQVTFFNNGHLVGSSIILIQIKDDLSDQYMNLLYTGDYKSDNILMKINVIPDWVYNLDNLTIITESTYGTTDTSDIKSVWDDDIEKACNENLSILIPVFAQGRMQEILYRIKLLQDKNIIPNYYRIEIAGHTGIQYNNIYMSQRDKLQILDDIDILPKNLSVVSDFKNIDSDKIEKSNPRILITTSGMGNYGPACLYIPKFLSNKNCLIYFVGYLSENTLGRRILECKQGEKFSMRGMEIIKNATVLVTSEYSSHAKANELIRFLNNFICARCILVTHGELPVKKEFTKRVKVSTLVKKVEILGNGFVRRITQYGIEKSIYK